MWWNVRFDEGVDDGRVADDMSRGVDGIDDDMFGEAGIAQLRLETDLGRGGNEDLTALAIW